MARSTRNEWSPGGVGGTTIHTVGTQRRAGSARVRFPYSVLHFTMAKILCKASAYIYIKRREERELYRYISNSDDIQYKCIYI